MQKKYNGRDLIALGYVPSQWFKEALMYLNSNELSEEERDEYLKKISWTPPTLEPFKVAKTYFKNIELNDNILCSEESKQNVRNVIETMDILMKTPTVVTGAIMPDACLAGALGQIPVGGICVTRNAIHPSMHSADICCSMYATMFENVDEKKLLDIAESVTHFGPGGRKTPLRNLPGYLYDSILNNKFLNSERSVKLAKTHFGTQGDGNHFLFVGHSKNTNKIALITHHGSRGFGALLYKKGMQIAETFRRRISPKTPQLNAWIPFDTLEGKEYWDALQIIREWTKWNHKVIHDTIHMKYLEKYGTMGEDYSFWNEHNFVFRDNNLFYHAKGATPLTDQFVPDSYNGLRIIPLNMKDGILIVSGTENENNLGFAPHGAGRNMSRTAHKKTKQNMTINEVFEQETKGLDIRFFSKQIDITELPSAYKDAGIIEREIKEFKLGEVIDRIVPYGCIMAGDWKRGYVRERI